MHFANDFIVAILSVLGKLSTHYQA